LDFEQYTLPAVAKLLKCDQLDIQSNVRSELIIQSCAKKYNSLNAQKLRECITCIGGHQGHSWPPDHRL